MRFAVYMRWEGWATVIAGGVMSGLGFLQGRQAPADAAIGGAMMLAGTGAFMAVRHRVPFRSAGSWFTSVPIGAAACAHAEPCRRRLLIMAVFAEAIAMIVGAVGLSYATGFWLTYMDCGVWAIAIGVIKIGPATSTIAEHEARCATSYLVARRRVRGLVELVER